MPDWQAVVVGSAGEAAVVHDARTKLQGGRDGCRVFGDGLWPQVDLEEVQEVHQCSPGIHIYPDLSSFEAWSQGSKRKQQTSMLLIS